MGLFSLGHDGRDPCRGRQLIHQEDSAMQRAKKTAGDRTDLIQCEWIQPYAYDRARFSSDMDKLRSTFKCEKAGNELGPEASVVRPLAFMPSWDPDGCRP